MVPDYPQSDCSGPACASIARGNPQIRVNVTYSRDQGNLAIGNNGSAIGMGALLNGKLSQFSLEKLIDTVEKLGATVEMEVVSYGT